MPNGFTQTSNPKSESCKHGASAMAIRSKTPIIPIVIYEKPRLFRCAHILIGDPVELTQYYDRKLTEEDFKQADDYLRNLMLNMKAEHKVYLENKKKKRKASKN